MSAIPQADEAQQQEKTGTFLTFPDSPFELFQPYPPAGDQPQAIDKLVEGVQDGEVFQTLLGVTGSGKTFTMANVIARLGRPTSPSATCSSRRTARSTSTSSRCGCRPPRACWSGATR
jgi:hypothetical protein